MAGEPQREAMLHEILAMLRDSPQAGQSACALCRRVERSVERGIRDLFAEFVNDPQVRDAWRRARGFCQTHAQMAADLGDALGVAILYADLARMAREEWEADTGAAKRRLLPRSWRAAAAFEPCPACRLASEADARCAQALAAALSTSDSEEVWDAVSTGEALCVFHIDRVIAESTSTSASRLRRVAAGRMALLENELVEIIRKNDYRFRGEPWGTERDAWLRALRTIRRKRP